MSSTTTTTKVSSIATTAAVVSDTNTVTVTQQYDQRSRKSANHRSIRKSDPSCERVDRVVNQCVAIALSQYVKPKDRVLDLGCGQLGTLPRLLRLGIGFYLGLDVSTEAITEGHRRLESFRSDSEKHAKDRAHWVPTSIPFPTVKLHVLDLNKQQLTIQREHDKFDVVICLNVLHYLQIDDIFCNVARCLIRKGGYFIVLDVDGDQLLQRRLPEWYQMDQVTEDKYRLTNKGLVHHVIEKRLPMKQMDECAKRYGLHVCSMRSVWDVYRQYEFTLYDAHLFRPWPVKEDIQEAERNLLKLYHIYVFCCPQAATRPLGDNVTLPLTTKTFG